MRLRTAADAQAEVSAFVSGMAAGESIASAADAMPGLQSGAACQFASTVLDGAAAAVRADLSAHAANLISAADSYLRADDELGRRMRSLAE